MKSSKDNVVQLVVVFCAIFVGLQATTVNKILTDSNLIFISDIKGINSAVIYLISLVVTVLIGSIVTIAIVKYITRKKEKRYEQT